VGIKSESELGQFMERLSIYAQEATHVACVRAGCPERAGLLLCALGASLVHAAAMNGTDVDSPHVKKLIDDLLETSRRIEDPAP
jgi:hypothetical protein